ncbi:MAG: outer membrane beta-barrel protein [Burkholderiaceae bacterium]|nr:outer membrane beta-barrel protein [Burkholderiaceae bacterium]
MKIKQIPRTAGLIALTALASSLVMAQETSGWYVGGNIGRSSATIDNPRIIDNLLSKGLATTSMLNDDRDTGGKIFGGYQLNKNFALEAGYFDLGRFSFAATTVPAGTLNGNIRLRGVNLDAVGILPLTERFSVLGRIGLNYAQARDGFSGTGAVVVTNPSPSKRDTNLKLGLGLMYAFTDSLAIRLEAERYRINDAVGNRGHVDQVSLGLVYRFGAKTPVPVRAYAPAPVYVAQAPAPAPVPAPVVIMPPPVPPPAPVYVPPPAPRPAPAPMRVSFSSDSLFDFDSSVLKPTGQQALDKLVSDLGGVSYDAIAVTGHTDRLGSHAYNLKLSTRRADAVSVYLVKSGIPSAKITSTGVNGANSVTGSLCKGTRPTPALIACLQPDRRVEVHVTGTR